MSTNSECLFFKWDSGMWYYLLEDSHAPKNSWDWREYAQCYGPFQDQEEADTHLGINHANPGGCSIDESANCDDEMLKRHVKEADDRKKNTGGPRWLRGWRVS